MLNIYTNLSSVIIMNGKSHFVKMLILGEIYSQAFPSWQLLEQLGMVVLQLFMKEGEEVQ